MAPDEGVKSCDQRIHCGCEDLRSVDLELEAAVARGKSKYGSVTFRGIERAFRKLTFDGRRSSSRALSLDDRALLPASGKSRGLSLIGAI